MWKHNFRILCKFSHLLIFTLFLVFLVLPSWWSTVVFVRVLEENASLSAPVCKVKTWEKPEFDTLSLAYCGNKQQILPFFFSGGRSFPTGSMNVANTGVKIIVFSQGCLFPKTCLIVVWNKTTPPLLHNLTFHSILKMWSSMTNTHLIDDLAYNVSVFNMEQE